MDTRRMARLGVAWAALALLVAGCGSGDDSATAGGSSTETSADQGDGPVPDEVQDLIENGPSTTQAACAAELLTVEQINHATGLEFSCDGDSYTTTDGQWLSLQHVERPSPEEAAAEYEGFLEIDGYEAREGDGWQGVMAADASLLMGAAGRSFFAVHDHARDEGGPEQADVLIDVLEALIDAHA